MNVINIYKDKKSKSNLDYLKYNLFELFFF